MAGKGGGKGSGGGRPQSLGAAAGKASNAALDDDEDIMNRGLNRRTNFNKWKSRMHPRRGMIRYNNSPKHPKGGDY